MGVVRPPPASLDPRGSRSCGPAADSRRVESAQFPGGGRDAGAAIKALKLAHRGADRPAVGVVHADEPAHRRLVHPSILALSAPVGSAA